MNYGEAYVNQESVRGVQAGDSVRAMRALLQTHDRERVVRFAAASRSPPCYLLAAQFLQASGAWLREPETLAKIRQFYAKAKSPAHTGAFFEACALAELDEGRDYERAAAALQVRRLRAQLDTVVVCSNEGPDGAAALCRRQRRSTRWRRATNRRQRRARRRRQSLRRTPRYAPSCCSPLRRRRPRRSRATRTRAWLAARTCSHRCVLSHCMHRKRADL